MDCRHAGSWHSTEMPSCSRTKWADILWISTRHSALICQYILFFWSTPKRFWLLRNTKCIMYQILWYLLHFINIYLMPLYLSSNLKAVDAEWLEKARHFSPKNMVTMFYYRPQRSWGKVIYLTGVCDSVHWGGGVCSRGVWSWGCLVWGGGVWSQGVSGWGGGVWSSRGVCSPGGAWWRHPRDGYCCGRYASYWNAFLWKKSLTRKVTWYLLKLSFADIYSGQMPFRISFKIKVSFESCGNKSDGWYTLMYKCPDIRQSWHLIVSLSRKLVYYCLWRPFFFLFCSGMYNT